MYVMVFLLMKHSIGFVTSLALLRPMPTARIPLELFE